MKPTPNDAERLLDRLRPRAFAVAYRMLGSVADAEDVAQEAMLRVHRTLERGERIEAPAAFVATVTMRLALDELRSARARRTAYVGEWLPEPVLTTGDDAAAAAELADSLSIAFLALLERLSPEQRAALLLRDAFDYEYEEIADVIGTSAVNARQLVARGRRLAREGRPRFHVDVQSRDALARRFFSAVHEGDLAALESLLAEDVVLRGDGGGKVPALTRPLQGRTAVARTLVAWGKQGIHVAGGSIRMVGVNGQPGALALDRDGGVIAVLALDVAADGVCAVTSIVNPDKLRHIGVIGDMRAVQRFRA